MASSSAKLLTSLLLLSLLSVQIHARESNFFSKVPNNNNNGDKFPDDTQIPNKVDPLTNPEKTTTTPQDQEPNFIPQTQDHSYGLYGHESGQLPPNYEYARFDPTSRTAGGRSGFTTTSTAYKNNDDNYRRNDAVPYKSESEDQYYNYNNDNNNDNFQNSNSKPYENSFYYNKDLYDSGRQSSFYNTRLSRDDYTTTPLYEQEKYGDNANNVARQGMSDTRFMEKGKYYYDVNMEPHHYHRSRGNFGNNNNNNNYNYNGNGNTYEYGNSMGRYQNDEAAEFQEEPDEFVP